MGLFLSLGILILGIGTINLIKGIRGTEDLGRAILSFIFCLIIGIGILLGVATFSEPSDFEWSQEIEESKYR